MPAPLGYALGSIGVLLSGILVLFPQLFDDYDDPVGVQQFIPINLRSHYDYIVVGGGSAGCVVARRLAELRDKSVLLIEGKSISLSLFYLVLNRYNAACIKSSEIKSQIIH